MYSINNVPLDNSDLGWSLQRTSRPLSGHTMQRATLAAAGRDGVVSLPGAVFSDVGIDFVVRTPRANHEALVALFAEDGVLSLTEAPTREARFEFLASSPVGYGAAEEIVDVTFTIRLIDAFWRSRVVTTVGPTGVGASTVVVCFPGSTAPIQDAVVRVSGACEGLVVTDTSGAWFSFPDVPAGQWLRVEGRRAFLTTSDAWAGGEDVSGELRQGGPRRRFEITSRRGVTPTDRGGRVVVTTATSSGAAIQIRGRGAFLQAER